MLASFPGTRREWGYTLLAHVRLPRLLLGNLGTSVFVSVLHDRDHYIELSHVMAVNSRREVAFMNQSVLCKPSVRSESQEWC